jgi:hypothetical protein
MMHVAADARMHARMHCREKQRNWVGLGSFGPSVLERMTKSGQLLLLLLLRRAGCWMLWSPLLSSVIYCDGM